MLATSDSLSLPDREPRCNSGAESAISEPEYLSECSPKDKPWDRHRAQADQIAAIYLNARNSRWYARLGERIGECSEVLAFAWSPERDGSGVLTLKLRSAQFCRVRHCPVCQWRRSLMWMARFLQAAPRVFAQYPDARPIFLTLTQENVPITELRTTLHEMGKAWERFTKRKKFSALLGWIRTAEVTRAKDGLAHPHFHVLFIVPSDYVRRHDRYVTHAGWTAAWREALRLNYDPMVHVRAVRSKHPLRPDGAPSSALLDGARETFKYAVKPADMTADPLWLLELTRQLHKLRFIASGGILKDMLREDDETNDDLLVLGEGETAEAVKLYFDWWRPVRRYKRRSGIQ